MDQPSPPFSSTPTVLLLEQNELLRANLCAWLHQEFPHIQVEARASLVLAEAVLVTSPVQVVLVDIDPWHGEGLANLLALRMRMPVTALIALTLQPPGFLHAQAIEAGASACASIALSDDRLRDLLRGLLPSHAAPSP